MKKMLLICIAVAGVSTNCTASEIAGTVNTMAQTVATVTNTAEKATKHLSTDEPVVVIPTEASEPAPKTGVAKWWGNATAKYDEVTGGREAIATLRQKNADLESENRVLRAKNSFVGDNLKPFSTSLERVCYLYDAGGIKEALGVK